MAAARPPGGTIPMSGSGSRVRKAVARWISSHHLREGVMTGDSFIMLVYRTGKRRPQYLGENFLEFDYF
jgi:hypothetical protein